MMEPRLDKEIGELEKSLRQARFYRELAFAWLGAAAAGVVLLLGQIFVVWKSPVVWQVPLLVALGAAGAAWWRDRRRTVDVRVVVTLVELEFPELRHLFSAATEQEPDVVTGQFRYLQLRVINEVLAHPRREAWWRSLEHKLHSAKAANLAALGGLTVVLLALGYSSDRAQPLFASLMPREITVTPGDTEVERGTSLVVAARFSGTPPAEATLVVTGTSGQTKRIALERHLADPVFGASLEEVGEDARYHVEYRRGKTRDFKITVFDYPALARADALLKFPGYTGLTNKTIIDTRRISAVEGTRLMYWLQFNKPVTRAQWVGKDQSLPLTLQSNGAALLADFPLTRSTRYTLALQDASGRTNKVPAEFVLQVLTNQRPELKMVFPHGDPRVSRIEELQLEAEAEDDFGLLKYGVGFGLAGQEPKLVELGQSAPGNQKRQFNYLIPLEDLNVEADQALAYFVWADDYGPDGKVRRTSSDIYFAEVRPFEETFRASQGGEGQAQSDAGVDLAEMQKEIVIATWKLEQDKTPSAPTKAP
jgi:hypothetical protein